MGKSDKKAYLDAIRGRYANTQDPVSRVWSQNF